MNTIENYSHYIYQRRKKNLCKLSRIRQLRIYMYALILMNVYEQSFCLIDNNDASLTQSYTKKNIHPESPCASVDKVFIHNDRRKKKQCYW
jgi:hypothetical protein